MKLRQHQQKFLNKNPPIACLYWACRTGKSLPASLWAQMPERNKTIVVICIKKNKKEWQNYFNIPVHVFTKEEFKKAYNNGTLPIKPTSLIVDEIHNFASALMIPKTRSHQAECLYNYIDKNPTIHRLFLSATVLTNNPASLHTLLTYLGEAPDWKDFRRRFYTLENRPYLPRPAWFPQKNWRQRAYASLEKRNGTLVDIVSLADCVDYLPEVLEDFVELPAPKDPEADHWQAKHQAEQTKKTKWIVACGYRKLIVVAHYRAQVEEIAREVGKHRPIYMVHGGVKDPMARIEAWQKDTDGYLIISATMGEGFDGYTADAMIFVSQSFRVIDYIQMKERLTTLINPKPKHYIYLFGGKWDKHIYRSLKSGVDFDPTYYE